MTLPIDTIIIHPDRAEQLQKALKEKQQDSQSSLFADIRIHSDPLIEKDKILVVKGHQGKSVLDTGFFYSPYIPIVKTPSFFDKEEEVPNSPLEDFVEQVFAEEIEKGELKPLRPKPKSWHEEFTISKPLTEAIKKSAARAKQRGLLNKIKPDYYQKVNISDLS